MSIYDKLLAYVAPLTPTRLRPAFSPIGRSASNSELELGLHNPDIASLVNRMRFVLCNVEPYKRLVQCQGKDAQTLLDSLQKLLDIPGLDPLFKRSVLIAIQRISMRTGLYPTCYELKDVVQDSEYPVNSGGFADIFKGRFQGKIVCIKMNRFQDLGSASRQFAREMLLWGQLSHPNIVPIYGIFRYKGRPCMVSQWMENGNIHEYLKKNLEAPRLQLAADVARGLFYLHDFGIVHGDLKSPNILIDDNGRARLTDFGISSASDSKVVAWSSQTKGASVGGSLRWQAPELFEVNTDEPIMNTVASDVYAWGCVCFEIFTGEYPFNHILNDYAVMLNVRSGGRPLRPHASSPPWKSWGLTKEIWLFMERCWKQDPKQRPSSTEIIQYLLPKLRDTRLTLETEVLLPAAFRRRVSHSFGLVDVKTLDNILSNAVDLRPGPTQDEWIVSDVMESQPMEKQKFNSTPILKGRSWWEEVRADDRFINEGQKGDVVVLLMGPRGAYRSAFLHALLGVRQHHKPNDERSFIQHYRLPSRHCQVFIADIPALDDTSVSDCEIFRRIAVWMAKLYCDGLKIPGILYLQESSATSQESQKFFALFEKLCGYDVATNIALVTPKDVDLNSPGDYEVQCQWAQFLQRGSRVREFDGTRKSAHAIVKEILASKSLDSLQIQWELVGAYKLLGETEAGRTLCHILKEQLRYHEDEVELLEDDEEGGEPERESIEYHKRQIQALSPQVNALDVPFGQGMIRMRDELEE